MIKRKIRQNDWQQKIRQKYCIKKKTSSKCLGAKNSLKVPRFFVMIHQTFSLIFEISRQIATVLHLFTL